MSKQEFAFRFDKNAAAAHIDHQAFVVLVTILEENMLDIGSPGMCTRIPIISDGTVLENLFFDLNHNSYFYACGR